MISRLLMWLFSRCEVCGQRLKLRDFMEVRIGARQLFIGHASCFNQLPEQRQHELFKEWGAIA
jgi:hypothetical protein